MKTRKEKVEAIIEILLEARNAKAECESSLVRIYQHMFKCYCQPSKHSVSWDNTIIERHKSINIYMEHKYFKDLKNKEENIFKKALNAAIKDMEIKGKSDKQKVELISREVFNRWSLEEVIYNPDFLSDFFKESPRGTSTHMYNTRLIDKYLN